MPYESIGYRLRREQARANRIAALKMDYEMVRKAHPEAKLKPYEELTKGERDTHEEIFNSTARFMAKLGKALYDEAR